MKILRVRFRNIKLLAVLVIAVAVVLNLVALNNTAAEDIETVDLGVLSGKVIAIDPGHGGIDSGAKYNGLLEKDITLAFSLKLGEVLKANGATVVFTRDSDIDYYTRGRGGKRNDLLKRVNIINNSGAAVFISIHTNAISGARWSGAEAYYNPKLPESKQLAETLQRVLQGFPPGNKRQVKQDSDILVLKDTAMAGALVEAGFLSNPREAAMLADAGYQQQLAEHIAKALAYHFRYNVAR